MADEVAELQLFVEIVRAGNLSAAARALNSSPAAMSRGLSTLESRLGVRLVTRTSRTSLRETRRKNSPSIAD